MAGGTSNPKKNVLLLVISAVLLIITIVLITIIPCPSDSQFFFYKIILALSVAGLASILPGFLRIKYKGYLSAGGGMAVFVFVLSYNPDFIKNNPRCQSSFDLAVHFYGDSAKSKVLDWGDVLVVYGGKSQRIPVVKTLGLIKLEELPGTIIGEPIQIIPQIEDYSSKQITFILTDQLKSKDLVLEPIKQFTTISGSVYYNESVLKYGKILIDTAVTQTNEYGMFSIKLPVKEGTSVIIRVLKDGQEIFKSTEPATAIKKEIYIGKKEDPGSRDKIK